VIAEWRHSFAVEDPVYADVQLFVARQALSGFELESFARGPFPLLSLFGHPSGDMSRTTSHFGSVYRYISGAHGPETGSSLPLRDPSGLPIEAVAMQNRPPGVLKLPEEATDGWMRWPSPRPSPDAPS
jgi:hypothetical protein